MREGFFSRRSNLFSRFNPHLSTAVGTLGILNGTEALTRCDYCVFDQFHYQGVETLRLPDGQDCEQIAAVTTQNSKEIFGV